MKTITIALMAAIAFTFAACKPFVEGNTPDPNSLLTGTVYIRGTAQVGQTLRADTDFLDGSGMISYEWKRVGLLSYTYPVGYESTYTVQDGDLGYTITVTVTRSDKTGSVTSRPTATVIAAGQTPTPTPVADDFVIGNLTQTVGNVVPVTITPKPGKSSGAITILYISSSHDSPTTLPTEIGKYTVLFYVAAADGWNEASGLVAGTLTINAKGPAPKIDAQVPVITVQPEDATVGYYRSYTLSVEANVSDGGTLSYQWYISSSREAGFEPSGSESSSGSYSPFAYSAGIYYFFVEITNTIDDNGGGGNNTASVRSNVVEITISQLSEIVVVDVVNLGEWELSVQNVNVFANTNKIFVVRGTYAAYRWYLDGVQVGDSSSYVFNKPVGVYQLFVVATNSEGASRSGRCWVTVSIQPPALTAGVWANGSINDGNDADWYSFQVVSGTTYYIWWNDWVQGVAGMTGDVVVGARYENAATFIFGGTDRTVDSGWNTPQSFTANQTGTVYIRVVATNSREGFYFLGTYGIVYSTSSTRPTHTITFNINGGNGTTPAAQTTDPGSSITLPSGSGLSRSGYRFGGWNTNPAGIGTHYNADARYSPTTSLTLYAQWDLVHTVTFNINGGNSAPAAQMVSPGSDITLPSSGNQVSRSGYSFGGWNTNAAGTGTDYSGGSSFTPTGNITLYARWYSAVTFNGNGGGSSWTESVNAGSSIAIPDGDGLARNNYAFGGWNSSSSGTGTNYYAGNYFVPTGNIALYARWHSLTALSNNVWANGTLTETNNEFWYRFSVTSGTRYSIWLNDSRYGDGTKAAMITVSVRYAGSSAWIIRGNISTVYDGWVRHDFTADQSGTVEVRVIPWNRNNNYGGTFGLVYSTGSARP